ncbi:MAG TPA: class I SAM-dependent methyltransferase [Candidatus Baltobacteraceae bacterium]|nr:class I SAM-dependent methyltransferase [Candidatus Baltobacteraceae bacterium]
MKHSTISGFFDAYPDFYETSLTGATPQRLNARHTFIVERNRQFFEGARVVDLASHDGRWSFAAHKAGAAHVFGIEARPELVAASRETMRRYGVAESQVAFAAADALRGMQSLPDASCDTVLCLGFFYHTLQHAAIFEQMARIARRAWIIDTAVCPDPHAVIRVERVDATAEWNAVPMGAIRGTALEGRPSRRALELLIEQYGFSYAFMNWHDGSIRDWQQLEDYSTGNRITLVAYRNPVI